MASNYATSTAPVSFAGLPLTLDVLNMCALWRIETLFDFRLFLAIFFGELKTWTYFKSQ